MKLLALLIVLALRRVEWRHGVEADPDSWHNSARAVLPRLLLAPLSLSAVLVRTATGRLLALVVFWVAIGFLLRFGLADVLLSLPLLLIYAALLWVCIGPDHLGHDINEYLRRWYLHDSAEFHVFVQQRFGVVADDAGALHRGVLRAVFVRAFREHYAWIIVFAFTGLPGLLALAVIHVAQHAEGSACDEPLRRAAQDMRSRLDWLLVRLLGGTLLLTGNSARVWPILDSRMLDTDEPVVAVHAGDASGFVDPSRADPAHDLLADLCVAASGLSPQIAAASNNEPDVGLDMPDVRGLLLRTYIVWIMLMAVSVIIGF